MEEWEARISALESRLHAHPEESGREYETTKLLRAELTALGLQIVDLGLETGVAARLGTGRRGPVIGLRADIDAIRQHEAVSRADASACPGLMHACGHDVHAAGLLGAAMLLSARRDALSGDVVFLFQPSEEVLTGAGTLIAHGLFETAPMDALFGLHNAPFLPFGTVGVRRGPLMAAKDDFTLRIAGVGGHGGMPHTCVDPIVAAGGVIGALQTIVSRNVSPLEAAVVSVCSIHGGTPANLIVDEVSMTGSIRTLSPDVRETVLRRFRQIAVSCAEAYGCRADCALAEKTAAVVNGALYGPAYRAACDTVGEARVVSPAPVLASEDFSAYGPHVPSFFYFLGSGPADGSGAPWHSDRFRADPGTAALGARLLTNACFAYWESEARDGA